MPERPIEPPSDCRECGHDRTVHGPHGCTLSFCTCAAFEPPSDSLGDRVRAAHAVEREAVGMLDYLYEIPRSAWHMLDGHDWHDIDATRIGCRCGARRGREDWG